MPQLHPDPWFQLLTLTWLVLLTLLTPKLSHFQHPAPVTPPTAKPTTMWPWPWP